MDRDHKTCLCKNYETLQFIANKVEELNIIRTVYQETLVGDIVCDNIKRPVYTTHVSVARVMHILESNVCLEKWIYTRQSSFRGQTE